MPTKIMKNNSNIFSKFFPEQLKYADVKAVFKKDSRTDKKTIDQSAFWLMYLKIMKGVSSNWRNIFRHCYLNINIVVGKGIAY